MHFPESLKIIADTLWRIDRDDAEAVIEDLMTPSEVVELAERIMLLRKLKEWKTQRAVAEELGMSVTTVSRWARVLKYGRGVVEKYI